MTVRPTLEEYLEREYPFNVIADPDGGYVIVFPDLPGCMTVADDVDEIGPMAEDARRAWITTAYHRGMDIPAPSYPEEYSGRVNVRLPRSLHRRLAERAAYEGVSLNTLVISLLERSLAALPSDERLRRIEEQLAGLTAQVSSVHASLTYRASRIPHTEPAHKRFRVVHSVKNVVAA